MQPVIRRDRISGIIPHVYFQKDFILYVSFSKSFDRIYSYNSTITPVEIVTGTGSLCNDILLCVEMHSYHGEGISIISGKLTGF